MTKADFAKYEADLARANSDGYDIDAEEEAPEKSE